MHQRGLLIVVEGLDRSGKSTQCTLLTKHLSSHNQPQCTDLVKFPDRTTPTGQIINQYLTSSATSGTKLSDHAIHLLFSANRWEAVPSILSRIQEGTTVVVDRYSFSGAVYSAAKSLPNLGLEWAWAPEIGLPRPDLVLFLDVSEETQYERGGFGDERYETVEMQQKVRRGFGGLWSRLPDVEVMVIDATADVGEVEQRIWSVVAKTLGNTRGEVGTLQGLK